MTPYLPADSRLSRPTKWQVIMREPAAINACAPCSEKPSGWVTLPWPETFPELVVWYSDKLKALGRATWSHLSVIPHDPKRINTDRAATLQWSYQYTLNVHRWLEHQRFIGIPPRPEPFSDFGIAEREMANLLRFLHAELEKNALHWKKQA